jgi:hypothetical protein
MDYKYPNAALVSLTLQNGMPLVVNAHSVVSVNIYGSEFVSALKLIGDDKIYILTGSPSFIKGQLETAIRNSK